MAIFTANVAINVNSLVGGAELATPLSWTFSNESTGGFTGSDNGFSFVISGSLGDFTYISSIPTGGTAQQLVVEQGSATLWSLSGFSVNVLQAALNPSLLTPAVVLAGNDKITGSPFADFLDGFAGKDKINGGRGNDSIDGGGGKDVLRGGPGADLFLFDSALNPHINVDKIMDFRPGQHDKIGLSEAIFAGLGSFGKLKGAHFANEHATNAKPEIVYTHEHGFLYYAPHGDHGKLIHFATLATDPATMHASDFVVLA